MKRNLIGVFKQNDARFLTLRLNSLVERGIFVVQVDPTSCTLTTPIQYFDPYAQGGGPFNTYVSNVKTGAVIAAVSTVNPQASYVVASLASIGVLVSDVPFRGSFAFVTQKGYQEKAVFSKTTTDACGVTSYMSVAVFGEFSSPLGMDGCVCVRVWRRCIEQ
jgi:hypothetical protein